MLTLYFECYDIWKILLSCDYYLVVVIVGLYLCHRFEPVIVGF